LTFLLCKKVMHVFQPPTLARHPWRPSMQFHGIRPSVMVCGKGRSGLMRNAH
jgi:hypothetical protein